MSSTHPNAAVPSRSRSFFAWFVSYLKSELKPYPGRGLLIVRYVLAATITMLVINTFRVPGAGVGGFYSLIIPRQSISTTFRAIVTLFCAIGISLASVLLGGMILTNYPLTHFLWVTISFFTGFYAIAVMTDLAPATAFTILMAIAIPAWDVTAPAAALTVTNLWTAGSIALAAVVTFSVELVFALGNTKDDVQAGVEQRLEAVRSSLEHMAQRVGRPKPDTGIQHLAMVGVSRLRQLVVRRSLDFHEAARLSTSISLIGRLVELTALAADASFADEAERTRLRHLAQQVAVCQTGKSSNLDPAQEIGKDPASNCPILDELAHTVDLLHDSALRSAAFAAPLPLKAPPAPLFAPDAWSNPEHLGFALRGCLAAMACYFFMNAVDWHSINSSIFTVVVSAMTSVGSSRQRQLMRAAGAVVGGLILGLGAEVLIFPKLDSIAGFTVVFVAVTAFAAWFITASPKISYFGVQAGLAFYIVQLSFPFPQPSLDPTRDNLMGIAFGLIAMWVFFEALGAKSAVVVMAEAFTKNIALLGELAALTTYSKPSDQDRLNSLTTKISKNFETIQAQGDALLFERDNKRKQKLLLREKLLAWLPRLRSLYYAQLILLRNDADRSSDRGDPSTVTARKEFSREASQLLAEFACSLSTGSQATDPRGLRQVSTELRKTINKHTRDPHVYGDRNALWLAQRTVGVLEALIESKLDRILPRVLRMR